MESIEQMVKELLELFLYQDTVNRMDSEDKLIKVYRVNPNIVRVDIKTVKGGTKPWNLKLISNLIFLKLS